MGQGSSPSHRLVARQERVSRADPYPPARYRIRSRRIRSGPGQAPREPAPATGNSCATGVLMSCPPLAVKIHERLRARSMRATVIPICSQRGARSYMLPGSGLPAWPLTRC